MNSVWRWGVLGLGVGAQHAHSLQALPAADLVAVCDSNPMILKQAALRYEGVATFGSAIDMLDSCQLDAAVIATYDNSHGALVIEALRRGIHVFVEKPVATSTEELNEIVRILRSDPNVRLSTNTLLRFSPRFRWLKAQIDEGTLGRIYHAEMSYLYGRLNKLTHGWRGSDPAYSVTLGGTIHVIDLLLWLCGERPTRCVAVGSTLGANAIKGRNHGTPSPQDLRVALLEFPSGLTAQVGANFACVFPHFHSVALFGSEATFFNLPGSSGVSDSNNHQPPGLLFASRDSRVAPVPVEASYPGVPKAESLEAFAQSLSGPAEAIAEQEAIDATAVALAIDEAVRSGAPVEVGYDSLPPRHRAS